MLVWRWSETRPCGTAGQVAPSSRIRRARSRRAFSPTLTATEAVVTGLVATTAVRVTTRSRAVMNSGGAVSEKAPRLLAVAVAIWANGPV